MVRPQGPASSAGALNFVNVPNIKFIPLLFADPLPGSCGLSHILTASGGQLSATSNQENSNILPMNLAELGKKLISCNACDPRLYAVALAESALFTWRK